MIAYCHVQWFQEMKYLKNEKQKKLAIDKKVIKNIWYIWNTYEQYKIDFIKKVQFKSKKSTYS